MPGSRRRSTPRPDADDATSTHAAAARATTDGTRASGGTAKPAVAAATATAPTRSRAAASRAATRAAAAAATATTTALAAAATAPPSRANAPAVGPVDDWYKDAVIYEVHVRAFQDSDGDGIGDFRGLISRLDHLQDLGVTALWLLPFYRSPLRDDGYDISDYRRVHPAYGTLRDFRMLLREAHRRGLRVITELVLAHTSDQHPWFQRARHAPEGSVARDFYVWSDTAERFSDARIIFPDFESSNWQWDPVAGAFYWHRFYSHQPALNYDSPAVRQAIFDVVDFWLDMGVDGMRLDAVPYLYAREGTTCENLPETLAFLRDLRSHVDEGFRGRMLLAEANQWPEDAAAYFGDGKACHMAFHFPLMPRMFMAVVQEDRFPILDILGETPPVPDSCQWALFLRNHDELTLEMVTDEERDYMYRAYAKDPQAKINVGIRRRLAPLLGNDRRLIEMMNGLLFSLPGTPIVYYGDEIGMGDNIYLGDRDAVRTPMQWSADRNAGFSRANPQQLYLPVIIDPEYQPPAVNVESQRANASSLLWWTMRLIGVRNRHRAFGRGSFEVLQSDNRKVLAFLRVLDGEHLLAVTNLSRHAQAVQLDLSAYRNVVPVELFGGSDFPPVGDLPYFITLGPYDFHWFSLERRDEAGARPRPSLHVEPPWTSVLSGRSLARLQSLLPAYVAERRWFRDKARRIAAVTVADVIAIGANGRRADGRGGSLGTRPGTGAGDAPGAAQGDPQLVFLQVELAEGSPETYLLPLAWAGGTQGEELSRYHPQAVVADLSVGDEAGVLYDAIWDPDFGHDLLALVGRRRQLPGRAGRLVGAPAPRGRQLAAAVDRDTAPVVLTGEQSNSSIVFDDQVVLKLIRQLQPGIHPGVEIGRHLGERSRLAHVPTVVGSVEYHPSGTTRGDPTTVVTAEEHRANEGDGWSYVVDLLRHGLEQAVARADDNDLPRVPPGELGRLVTSGWEPPEHTLIGPHLEWATQLGQQTADMHLALAEAGGDPAFTPEPMTATDRQAMYQGARSLLRRTLRQIRPIADPSPTLRAVVAAEQDIRAALHLLAGARLQVSRIRVHGDFHLGQVLWTGKDFVLIDFEGEPARSVTYRRLKRPALVDVAGMIRSFHYAAHAAAAPLAEEMASSSDPEVLAPLLSCWYRSVSVVFLSAYLDQAGPVPFVPPAEQLPLLLDFLLLDKAIYELAYEVNSRPTWVDIPAQGILDLLGSEP